MKKLGFLLCVFLFLIGCDLNKLINTPTKQVEIFLNKYQTLDKAVIDDLDKMISTEKNFDVNQKERYKNLMKEHYQNLQYNIKGETIDGDKATVTVEIEVKDYSKAIAETNQYLQNNSKEFTYANGEYNHSKFINYQLDKLDSVKNKVKYTLDLTLTNSNGKWKLDPLSSTNQEKINGIYTY